MRQFVSIDIGGTAIKYGVIAESGEILCSRECPTKAHLGGAHIIEMVTEIVEEMKKFYEISGVCISTAGMVDVEKGEVVYAAPLIPKYTGTQWKKIMEEKFEIPCEVENDVNCAGLAEAKCGAATGSNVALCLTVGTGIGGCILIDGNVFHGAGNSACEVGYMHMDGGSFQSMAATSVLCLNVEKRMGTSGWDGKKIFEEAKNGNQICIEEIDRMVDVLAKGIANISYVINPKTVVLGGGIMAQSNYLIPKINKRLKEYLVAGVYEQMQITVAKNGNQAGMLGAFYNFLMRQTIK